MNIFIASYSGVQFSDNEFHATHITASRQPPVQGRPRFFSESEGNFSRIKAMRMHQARNTVKQENIDYINRHVTHSYENEAVQGEIWSSEPAPLPAPRSLFANVYQPHQWKFMVNVRDPSCPYYASDVTYKQYELVSKYLDFSGVYPRVIIRENVSNTETLRMTERLSGDALMDAFFRTPNGKSTQHILACFNLKVRRVVRQRNDFYVYINPFPGN
ncbi:hypothetical protein FNU87_22395 [Salmonella enterica subsp. salamae]|nr:hypothetical protein [Salmonella enterica subsp. salamae]ECD9357293.1 hypothetical protein [Salmonella enterica subsp. salamae]EDV2642509.1 hypothetical protein [Salmonella enterica subsp. salamae]